VPTHKSPVGAAEILSRGTRCTASLLMTMPLGQRNDEGLEVIGLILEVTVASGTDRGIAPDRKPPPMRPSRHDQAALSTVVRFLCARS
jgi:hypothetical protein